jgi:phosphoribosyl 1,2-cyclic phosphate phosphodiesterase
MGLDDCRRFCEMQDAPMPIYASADTMRVLERVFEYAFNGAPAPKGYLHPDPRVITGPFSLGDLEVTPFALPHGRTTSNGFLFSQDGRKRLTYLSDCKEVPAHVIRQVQGVEVAVIEALRFTPHPTHLCLDEALSVARAIGADRTYLTHLTHDFDHDVHQARLPPGIELAHDGLRVELPWPAK